MKNNRTDYDEKKFYEDLRKGAEEAEAHEYYLAVKSGIEKEDGLVHVDLNNYKTGYFYYKAKYEAIRDATFWRMTEPLRRLVDFYQYKRYGIKKIRLEDEISVPRKKSKTEPEKAAEEQVKIGVHLHLYYEDLLNEFCDYLNHIPESFDLYISCKEDADKKNIQERAQQIIHVKQVVVKETQNRGRDIAPFYVLFAKDLLQYENVLHIHSKKSLYTGGEKANWRHEALDGVLKNPEMVEETLQLLRNGKPGGGAGLVFGEMTKMLPPVALHWLRNVPKGRALLDRLHVPFDSHMFFYPVGSFFWANVEAIKPLLQLGLKYKDFDKEEGQIDATLAHALERVVAVLVRHYDYDMYIYDADTNSFSKNKSYRCFREYFGYNPENLSGALNKDYEVFSFDIFDTLITRLVYEPDDVFRLMERKIESVYKISVDYLTIRKEAERIAWSEKGDFCNIHHIYEKLPQVSPFTAEEAEELKQMEIDLEYELCIPRKDTLELYNRLLRTGKPVILISDMYLTEPMIRRMLEKCGYTGYTDLWISCEKGKRKDRDTIWDDFLEIYGKYRTIHIGDNPHSDCQLVGDRRRGNLLLLSPGDQFRLSDQYEKFAKFEHTTVENSLILGYFVNKCLYNSPFALKDSGISKLKSVEDVSDAVFAPILLKFIDYLHNTSREDTTLLFLSREGYFLEKLYTTYCEAFGKKERHHEYFLTSRRATSVAQIHCFADTKDLFKTKYTGKISTLLKERFGLEEVKIPKDDQIELPGNASRVMRILMDYVPELLNEAQGEKELYLRYITQLLGDKVDWDKVTLVDVGYSGTIQYYLMKILDTKLDGCYMIRNFELKPEELDGTCRSLYSFWKDKYFMDAQLFLEAVTAAPHGQVVKFAEQDGRVEAELKEEKPVYGEKGAVLQEPVYQYVAFMGKMLSDIRPHFDKELASGMFSEILRMGLLDSGLRGLFNVSDSYCMDGGWTFNETRHRWDLKEE